MSFQAIKTRCFKSRKIDLFVKGLNDGFGPEMAIFESLVFLQIRSRESVFLKDLKEKQAFLDQQNISFKKTTKINIFLEGLVHGLCKKMEIF